MPRRYAALQFVLQLNNCSEKQLGSVRMSCVEYHYVQEFSVGDFLLTKGRRTYFRVLKKENYFVIILAGVGTVHICVIPAIFSLNPKIACLLLYFITYILKNE
jgi:hypothetical protein